MQAARSVALLVRHVGGAASEAILVAAVVGLIALVLAPVYGPARFMTGSGGVEAAPRTSITLSIAGATSTARLVVSGDVTYEVTRSVPSDDVLWVTQKCYEAAGAQVSRLDMAVVWGMWYSLDGSAGPASTAGSTCTAYATWMPWLDKAIRGTSITFEIAD